VSWRVSLTATVIVGSAAALAVSNEDLKAAIVATLVAATTAWIVADGRVACGSWVSSRVLLGGVLLFLVALPAFMLAARPSLFAGGAVPLTPGLVVLLVGNLSILSGASLAPRLAGTPDGGVTPAWHPVRGRRVLVVWALSALALVLFLTAAGGAEDYLSNLDLTAKSTAGLTYLIWGVLLAKYASFATLAHRWQSGGRVDRRLIAAVALSFVFVALVGTRLLLLVALVQVCLVFLLIRKPSRLPRRTLVLVALIGVVTLVGLGELRRWQGAGSDAGSFPSYLVDRGIPNLPGTYVNQYADSVRLSILVRGVVPAHADFEFGRELLRVALQPVPGPLRPKIERSPALNAAFSSPSGGNALPLPVVGFIQGGVPGIVLFCAAIGLGAGLIDLLFSRQLGLPALLSTVGAATGLVIVFRGSLAQGVAFALMDVVGFYAVSRFVLGRPD
jgi:hypothetical protein